MSQLVVTCCALLGRAFRIGDFCEFQAYFHNLCIGSQHNIQKNSTDWWRGLPNQPDMVNLNSAASSLTISRDKLNNIVSGFGAQDATNVLRVPYKPSEQYRRRNHTALIPPCRRTVIMAVFLKTGRRPKGDGRSIR